MKWTLGQIVCVALAVLLAGVLIYHAPFEAAAAVAASASQVVYAPIFDPPVIGGVAGRARCSRASHRARICRIRRRRNILCREPE